jgi:hypothetical protein
MVIGDNVGEIAVCSDCHERKKIGLEWSRGTGKDGQVYAPFLRCEDCVKLELDKDMKK